MKQLAIILTFFTFSFSWAQSVSDSELLFAFKLKPKQIEEKALNGKEDETNLSKKTARAYADFSDNVVRIPYALEKALRTPTAYGIDYESVTYYGISRKEVLTLVMVVEIKDYSIFKEAMTQDSDALFKDKGGFTEVFKNKVFTDGKKLIMLNTQYLNSSYGKPKLVNSKEEALTTKSMRCTKEEYAKQIIVPLEKRDFDTDTYHSYGYCGDYSEDVKRLYEIEVAEAIEEVREAAEVVEETATEAVEETTEDYSNYEEKQWYEIEYYRDYILVDNLGVAQLFFNNSKLNNSSSFSKFKSSKADQAYWLDNEQLLSTYQDILVKELPYELRKLYKSNLFLNTVTTFQGSSAFGEVFFNRGEVQCDFYTYGNTEFISNVKKINSNKVGKQLLKYLPEGSPAYAGGGVNINELFSQYESYFKKALKNVPKFDTIAEQSYELLKVIIDEDALAKIVNGQGLVYVDGYYEFEKHYTDYMYDDDYNYVKKDTFRLEKRPSVYSFIGTEDPEIWNRLAKILEQTDIVSKESRVYTFYDRTNKFRSYSSRTPREVGVYFTILEDAVVFSSDKNGLERIAKGKSNKPSKEQLKNFKKYNTYATIDFNALSSYLKSSGWIDGREPLKAVDEMSNYESLELKAVQYGSGYVKSSLTLSSEMKNLNILEHFMNSFRTVRGE